MSLHLAGAFVLLVGGCIAYGCTQKPPLRIDTRISTRSPVVGAKLAFEAPEIRSVALRRDPSGRGTAVGMDLSGISCVRVTTEGDVQLAFVDASDTAVRSIVEIAAEASSPGTFVEFVVGVDATVARSDAGAMSAFEQFAMELDGTIRVDLFSVACWEICRDRSGIVTMVIDSASGYRVFSEKASSPCPFVGPSSVNRMSADADAAGAGEQAPAAAQQDAGAG